MWLRSQRADLYGLVPAGKALGAEFGLAETYPKASVGYAAAAIPAGSDPVGDHRRGQKILTGYAEKGVPPALVEAARKGEIAGAEFQQNSISDLASIWSQALAAEGRTSPTEIVDAMKKVTVDDVNRVAKTYLNMSNAIVAILKPSPSGEAVGEQRLRRRGDHNRGAQQAGHAARLGRSRGEIAKAAEARRPCLPMSDCRMACG